eukprot:TRINITY_DN2588_c1_g1_i1.p1 TRINITY_DN2588_c1_g1~~TRINITY_DN2588_c1_g1_i1.p1  ORF type:complete len:847 (+),score=327.49 TRINITY_DN2588_c1_g1_i1:77-2617(+)
MERRVGACFGQRRFRAPNKYDVTAMPKNWGNKEEKFDLENRLKAGGARTATGKTPFVRSVTGSGALTRKKAAKWYPYKLDMPKLPRGMDHDYAVTFANPLKPHRCYHWDYEHMEELSEIDNPLRPPDPIPALYRVHTADVVVHEIDPEGHEAILTGNDPELASKHDETTGYLRFKLYKEGLRTTQAVYFLGKMTGIPLSAFSWSVGMDAKAATTQIASVEVQGSVRDTLQKLEWGMQERVPRGVVKVGGLEYSDAPVVPKSTMGKRVAMLLRNVRGAPGEIGGRVQALTAGFVNFYGVEKFGMTQGPRPLEITGHVLNGEYKDAFLAILEMEAFMNPTMERILNTVQRTDQVSQNMIDMVPSHLPHVRSLLVGLLKHKSFKAAYHSIAPAMRRMWETSLSALVWNRLARNRVALGMELLPGDVVWDRAARQPRGLTDVDVERINAAKAGGEVAEGGDGAHFTIYDIVIPVPGVPPHETKDCFYPGLDGCDFNAVMDTFEEYGVRYPFKLSKDHEYIAPSYRHLLVKPLSVSYEVYPHEMVNDRALVTDINAGHLGAEAGDVISVHANSVSSTHPLKTKGLAGMMYTFDWTCGECGTRNVFLRDNCEGCNALKELSVTPEDLEHQKGMNGDLKNCHSVYVSFAIPHSSYASVAVRDAFELHPWRFYPDGYFYQDVLQPLLQFHLNKRRISLPPTTKELKDDSWAVQAKAGESWQDTKMDGIFEVPQQRTEEFYARHSSQLAPWIVDNDKHYTEVWKEEAEAWWNVSLEESTPVHQKYVHDARHGGVIRVTEKEKETARSVPPGRFTLPITPLPASVRNTTTARGLYTWLPHEKDIPLAKNIASRKVG